MIAALRYVILFHDGVAEPHFDIMFETEPGSALATWRAPHWPIAEGDALTRLKDHRRDYLDYEGPISENRGSVRRVARGMLKISAIREDSWVVTLDNAITLTVPRQ